MPSFLPSVYPQGGEDKKGARETKQPELALGLWADHLDTKPIFGDTPRTAHAVGFTRVAWGFDIR